VEGIAGIVQGKHVLTGTTAKELADLTVKVLNDQQLSPFLADNSYRLVTGAV
jgi:hypothetical protein